MTLKRQKHRKTGNSYEFLHLSFPKLEHLVLTVSTENKVFNFRKKGIACRCHTNHISLGWYLYWNENGQLSISSILSKFKLEVICRKLLTQKKKILTAEAISCSLM